MNSHLVAATCENGATAVTTVVVPCPPLTWDVTVEPDDSGDVTATVRGAFIYVDQGRFVGQTVELDWGDGTPPDSANSGTAEPPPTDVTFTHTYAATGTYTLAARVPTQTVCSPVTHTVQVTVTEGAPALEGPAVSVTATDTTMRAEWFASPDAVTYTATATAASGDLEGIVLDGAMSGGPDLYAADWTGLTPATMFVVSVVAHAPGFADSPPGNDQAQTAAAP
jgi:hypothetical protein